MLKTSNSFLYWKSLLKKSQLRIRSLSTAPKCMTEQFIIEDKFVPRSRKTRLTNLPTFRFDSSLQRRMKHWNKLPTSTILWTNSKICPKFWNTSCLLSWELWSTINFVIYVFFCLVIRMIIFKIIFHLVFDLKNMIWNIGFSGNLFLKLGFWIF